MFVVFQTLINGCKYVGSEDLCLSRCAGFPVPVYAGFLLKNFKKFMVMIYK